MKCHTPRRVAFRLESVDVQDDKLNTEQGECSTKSVSVGHNLDMTLGVA
jgi:hypothetical protein